MLTRGAGRAYFAVQAAGGLVWWVSVFTVSAVREATLGGLDAVVVAILDIPLFVCASALVALGVRPALWVVVPWTAVVASGMALYATATGRAGWGALLMLAATAGSAAAGLLVSFGRLQTERILFGPFAFRAARPNRPRNHVGRTGAQIVVFWGLFLVVIPLIVAAIEQRWQLHLPLPAGWAGSAEPAAAIRVAGLVLLVAASALGIWSALTMSMRGEGTPLPSDMARRLVVSGPYRFVRNPMAVAGVAQGIAVGLMLNSWLVVAYALCGSLIWNRVVRPLEEADLETRFGEGFAEYRGRVSCWIPRRTWPRERIRPRDGGAR